MDNPRAALPGWCSASGRLSRSGQLKRSARRLSDVGLGTSGTGAERSWEYRFNPCENRLTPRQNAQQIPDDREVGTRPSFHHVSAALLGSASGSSDVMAILSLRGVSLAFGGPRLFDQVDLQIEPGERLCLLGRNGEGKSTLLRLISGEIEPDEGTIIRQQGLRITRLPQDVPAGHDGAVADLVARGLEDDDHHPGGADHRVQ